MKIWSQRLLAGVLFVALSLVVAWVAHGITAPMIPKVAVSFFAVLFIAAIGNVIWARIDRRLVGPVNLNMPAEVGIGATFNVQMRVQNAALAGRVVTFAIKCERFDKSGDGGWKPGWSSRALAPIARGTLTAGAAIEVPRDAIASTDGETRWQVVAAVEGHQRGEFSMPIIVRAASQDFGHANELLDDSRLEPLEFESALAPDAAKFDPATKSWILRESYVGMHIAGYMCLGFAVFWFWNTMPNLDVNALFAGDAQSLMAWGELMFRLPFVFGGCLITALGLAFVCFSMRSRISATEISQEVGAFGWAFRRVAVAPSEVLALRVIENVDAGNTLSLGVVSKRGVMVLPLRVTQADALAQPTKLRRHARWLADIIKRRDLAFDSKPHRNAMPMLTLMTVGSRTNPRTADAGTGRLSLQKISGAIGGGLAVLAFGGFGMMVAGGMMSDRKPKQSASSLAKEAKARKPDPNYCGYEDKSYCGTLIFATRQNNVEQVKTLLAKGLDPHERDANGWSPWAYALSRGSAQTINAFIDTEVPVRGLQDLPFNGTQRQSVPPLVFALGHGNAGAVQTLIKRGADANERGPYGYPAANFAAYYGNVAALKALKESGIDLLAATPAGQPHDGETFLMHAAEGGKPEAVDYLLSLGANASDRDPHGKNAGDHAKAYGHVALAEKLWALAKQ